MALDFSRRHTLQPLAEINTTPLVDVMLVLLVIFIVTAPLLQHAIPVDLPQVDAAPVNSPPASIRVELDPTGLRVEGVAVAPEALAEHLSAQVRGRSRTAELQLWADKQTAYERVAEVMAAAQAADIRRFAFVTTVGAATTGATGATQGNPAR